MTFKRVCENLLSQIILCDAITTKGKRSRDKLKEEFGLDDTIITKDYFFEHLYANPRYGGGFTEDVEDDSEIAAEQMFLRESEEEFTIIQDHLDLFHNRLWSKGIANQSVFLIQGVAGNGKTIWIMKELFDRLPSDKDFENNSAYFSMDDLPRASVNYGGSSYRIPNSGNVLELFAARLLEGIMTYVENTSDVGMMLQNYQRFIQSKGLQNDEWKMKELFEAISRYRNNNYITEKKIFELLKDIINYERIVARNAQECEEICVLGTLIKLLCLIMFCSNPYEMNYIVFDNIEFFIGIGDQCIQIYDEDIYALTETIYKTVKDLIRDFNYRLKDELGENNSFKVITIVRRTSLEMLYERLHSPELDNKNIIDITGSTKLVNIWDKKSVFGQSI